jgi:hypothetical protein
VYPTGSAALPSTMAARALVADDSVFDRVLDAADALDSVGLIVQPCGTGAVQHLQVLQRVLIDDRQVGEHARPDDAELDRPAFQLVQRLRRVHRRAADHLERMEAGLADELPLVDVLTGPR